MTMQIQRGLVKYKDRSDIVCTYGVTDTGAQFYFLDDGKLANGNMVVTSTLLEAVDPLAAASHVGVIDGNGNVVIPCEYKSIKPISNDVLLVERAQPVSQSVLDAIRLREDPLAATKLVTTPATIKEKINGLMGDVGHFVFNDQFSEATIFDIFGNNLVNNEYYSFIAINDEKVYLNKNTIDSDVVEYPLYPIDEEVINNKSNDIDVTETSVTTDSITNSINNEVDNKEENVYSEDANDSSDNGIYSEDANNSSDNNVYSEEINVPNDEVDAESTYEEEEITPSAKDNDQKESFELPDVDVNAAMPIGDVVATPEEVVSDNAVVEEPTPEVKEEEVTSKEEEEVPEEAKSINIEVPEEKEDDSSEDTEEYEEKDESKKVEDDSEVTDEEEYKYDEKEEYDYNESEVESNDTEESDEEEADDEDDDESDGEEDDASVLTKETYDEEEIEKEVESAINDSKISEYEDDTNDYYDYEYDEDIDYNMTNNYDYDNVMTQMPSKNLFDDVTTTISNLVELNRNLQSMVDEYEVKLNKCNTARKKLIELSKNQAREISSLNARIARLEADKQVLETKLASLTPSSNGELVRVMADAHSMIGKTQSRMRRKNNL